MGVTLHTLTAARPLQVQLRAAVALRVRGFAGGRRVRERLHLDFAKGVRACFVYMMVAN